MNQPASELPQVPADDLIDEVGYIGSAGDSKLGGILTTRTRVDNNTTHYRSFVAANQAVSLVLAEMQDTVTPMSNGDYGRLAGVAALCTFIVPVKEGALSDRLLSTENLKADMDDGKVIMLPPIAISDGDISTRLIEGVLHHPDLKDMSVAELAERHDRLALMYDMAAFVPGPDGQLDPHREVIALPASDKPNQRTVAALVVNKAGNGVGFELSLPAVSQEQRPLLAYFGIDPGPDGKSALMGPGIGNTQVTAPKLPCAMLETCEPLISLDVSPKVVQQLRTATWGKEPQSEELQPQSEIPAMGQPEETPLTPPFDPPLIDASTEQVDMSGSPEDYPQWGASFIEPRPPVVTRLRTRLGRGAS